MGALRWVGCGLVVLCTACGGAKQATRAPTEQATGGSGPVASRQPLLQESRRYVDQTLGFELTPPGNDWLLEEQDELSEPMPVGIVIPVALRHRATGAQMLLQVAPAAASPLQFIERLKVSMDHQPGFVTSEPEPQPLNDNAVGYSFTVGDQVLGRVVAFQGPSDRLYMLLATWPVTAPAEVPETVNAFFESVHPLPLAPEQT